MQYKRVQNAEVKATDKGEVTAVFSRLNVIDHDQDVTTPGAFAGKQAVRVSEWNHNSYQGALPVGMGTVTEEGDVGIFKGQFWLHLEHAKASFGVVKELGDLGEWSYGFDVLQADFGEFEGQNVRFLRSLKVNEVSPVLLGAGIGTGTLSAKQKVAELTNAELAEQAIDVCKALQERGVAFPPELLALAREVDAGTREDDQRNIEGLLLIGAAHGLLPD